MSRKAEPSQRFSMPTNNALAHPADLALFVRTVELGSFSAVAREKDLPASQVSRAVDRLEHLHGMRLLRRSTHGLSLTLEGETLLHHARRVLEALGDLSDELAAQRGCVRGVVRLAVSSAMAQRFILPALLRLARGHPDLRLDIHAEDRMVDLVAEGFDIALRTNHQGAQNLVAKRIGTYRQGVYATPAFLARWGVPAQPDDLEHFPAVTHLDAGHLNRWRFLVDGKIRLYTPRIRSLSANSTWLVGDMVLSDLGLGWLSTVMTDPLVRAGRLVEVLPEFHDPTLYDIHAVMLPERDRLPRIRAVVDLLVEALESRESDKGDTP